MPDNRNESMSNSKNYMCLGLLPEFKRTVKDPEESSVADVWLYFRIRSLHFFFFFFLILQNLGKSRNDKWDKLLFPSNVQRMEVPRSNKYSHFSLLITCMLQQHLEEIRGRDRKLNRNQYCSTFFINLSVNSC